MDQVSDTAFNRFRFAWIGFLLIAVFLIGGLLVGFFNRFISDGPDEAAQAASQRRLAILDSVQASEEAAIEALGLEESRDEFAGALLTSKPAPGVMPLPSEAPAPAEAAESPEEETPGSNPAEAGEAPSKKNRLPRNRLPKSPPRRNPQRPKCLPPSRQEKLQLPKFQLRKCRLPNPLPRLPPKPLPSRNFLPPSSSLTPNPVSAWHPPLRKPKPPPVWAASPAQHQPPLKKTDPWPNLLQRILTRPGEPRSTALSATR